MAGRRRNPIKTLFKVEHLTPNSVVIFRAGCAMDNKKMLAQLAGELAKRDLEKVIIMRLESLDDFHTLNEEQMNRLGWWRKESEDGEKPV